MATRAIVPRRLLVVDDDDGVRKVLASLLRSAGHKVVEAAGGVAGLERLAEHEVDLVCTEMGMPGMTGVEFARRAKARKGMTPILLLTGWGEDAVGDKKGEGVDGVLAKPVSTRVLLESIATLTETVVPRGA